MSQLPKVWVEVRAEDICDKVQSGSTPSNSPFTDSGDIPYLKVYNIVNQKIAFDYRKQFIPMEIHEEKSARSKVFPNDVLMNIVGPPLGKVAIVTSDYPEWNINQAITLFRTNNAFLLSKFLFYFLNEGSSVKSIHGELKGTVGQVNISLSQCRNFLVPLPPLAEQTCIVEKLDEVLAQVDTIKARLDGIPAILKRFRQSVLAAAVSGKLTEEWREESSYVYGELKHCFPTSWEKRSIAHLIDYVTSGSRGWAKYYANQGSLFIRSQDINTDELVFKDPAYVQLPEQVEGRRTKVQPNDILLTITGANVTKCARVKLKLEDAYVSQHVALIRLNAPENAPFVEINLKALNSGRKQLTDKAYGGGKPGLNLQNIKDVEIVLPPLVEQKEIVRLVDQYFALADTIEAQVKKAQTRVDKLTQAILAKAFRGELTADWRAANPDLISGDNSAAALLARIQAERVTASGKKGKRGTSKSRTTA